jgi:hypothetical protein
MSASAILGPDSKPITSWEVVISGEMNADYRTDKKKGLYSHDMERAANTKNFDQKVYLFPDSYNELRRELYINWQDTIWPHVSWAMAFAANLFVERMNEFLDLKVQLDSDRVDYICTVYLNELRKRRGFKVS